MLQWGGLCAPLPVTCRLPGRLDLAPPGEGYLGVATAVTQQDVPSLQAVNQRTRVSSISGAYGVESGLSLRVARDSGTGLLGTNNIP